MVCIPFGVIGVVGADSFGIANFEIFSSQILRISLITTKFYDNINPQIIDEDKIISLLRRHKDSILGLKLRTSKETALPSDMESLKKTRKIADKTGCIINIHATNPVGSIVKLLEYLNPGDISTHVFRGKGKTIIKDGAVLKEIYEARDKGILFDAANGRNHFSFDVAQKAIEDGFFPDIISTDITKNTLMKPPVFSLVYILSKYLALGMKLTDIIPTCTSNAAKIMGLSDSIGAIISGNNADITIFNIIDQKIIFQDFNGKILVGEKSIEPVVTIKDGVILFLNPRYVDIVRRG